jgi:hypothetical protein
MGADLLRRCRRSDPAREADCGHGVDTTNVVVSAQPIKDH